MKLFDLATLKKIMNFSKEEIQTALEAGNWFIGEWENEDSIDYPLALAICYASQKYPKATHRQIAIFATCIQGFTTGLWGGFGLDQDPLMRKAEDAVTTLAGGVPPQIADPENEFFGLMPEQPILSPEEMTKAGMQLLENVIFKQDTEEAVRQALAYLEKNIELLEKSKSAFKSKLVAEAREQAEQARTILMKILQK